MLPRPAVFSLLLGAQGGFYTEGWLVLVNASVFDDENRFRAGLPSENFQRRNDGAEVRLRSVPVKGVPLSTAILLDVSRSMAKSIEQARITLGRYLDKARSGDEYCLIVFSDRTPAGCEYLTDAAEVRARAADTVTGGGTALVDALHTAITMVKKAHSERRAILILSDGLDNSSARRWKAIRRELFAALEGLEVRLRGEAAQHPRVYWRHNYSTQAQ
ncbi:MAG: VWA domain-containing protein [Acidobacteria bacterium]|nr:VWA domain-containing protein [Acidobacteriota bacterium]